MWILVPSDFPDFSSFYYGHLSTNSLFSKQSCPFPSLRFFSSDAKIKIKWFQLHNIIQHVNSIIFLSQSFWDLRSFLICSLILVGRAGRAERPGGRRRLQPSLHFRLLCVFQLPPFLRLLSSFTHLFSYKLNSQKILVFRFLAELLSIFLHFYCPGLHTIFSAFARSYSQVLRFCPNQQHFDSWRSSLSGDQNVSW